MHGYINVVFIFNVILYRMLKLLCTVHVYFTVIVVLRCCKTQQTGEGFNIYKDFQIGKSNEVLKDDDNNESHNKDELILPSVAAKIHVEDTSNRNGLLFRNLMISREIPEPKIFQDAVVSDPFALMIIPESKVTVPRIMKSYGLKTFDKKSGIYDEVDAKNYQLRKRTPGSVLTWALAPSRTNHNILSMRSEQGKHFQPSSFVATMGKRSVENY